MHDPPEHDTSPKGLWPQGGIPVTPRTHPIPSGRPTFLDVPRGADLDLLDADVAVIGVPYTTPHDLASSRASWSGAPESVREQSRRFAGRTTHYDFDLGGALFADRRVRVVDCGGVWAAPGQYERNARNATAGLEALLEGRRGAVVPGGGHRAPIPAVAS